MRLFTASGYSRAPNLIALAVTALVSAALGGLLMLGLAPGYIADRAGLTGADPGLPGQAGGLAVTWGGDWPVVAVAETVGASVVGVVSQTTYNDWFYGRRIQESGGSGVVVRQADGYGYILTNQHVTGGADRLYVVLSDGRRLEAELAGEDWWTDLALLKVRDDSLPVAQLGDSDLLRPGELVVAIGNPLGMEFQRSITVGVVSGLNRAVSSDEREFRLIQTDAAINPGNSGGPLVNASGEVIGINNMKFSGQGLEGIGFAIPSNTARRVLGDLIVHGRVIRAYLGVSIVSAVDAQRHYGLDLSAGLYVSRVVAGSPAAQAGIRQGDIIRRIDAESVSTLADLRRVLDRRQPGDRVSVEIVRGGQTTTLTVTLGDAPSAGR